MRRSNDRTKENQYPKKSNTESVDVQNERKDSKSNVHKIKESLTFGKKNKFSNVIYGSLFNDENKRTVEPENLAENKENFRRNGGKIRQKFVNLKNGCKVSEHIKK